MESTSKLSKLVRISKAIRKLRSNSQPKTKSGAVDLRRVGVDRYADTTLSMGVPASIVLNAQSAELQTYLVGQIARAASIFRVDEIVIVNDCESAREKSRMKRDVVGFFVKNLEYLETPQYLRKALFPVLPELQYTGLMNPLDAPHHLRQEEESPYREGVVIDRPVKEGKGSWVNIGLKKECQVDMRLATGTRITVKLAEHSPKHYTGTVVSSLEPKRVLGKYWGYTIRVAENLLDALNNCPYTKSGYDLVIGTSDKGQSHEGLVFKELRTYSHALIMFGGLPGIEGLVEGDEALPLDGAKSQKLFKYYVNTCPKQGCRTIRTEEAIYISLAVLVPKLGR